MTGSHERCRASERHAAAPARPCHRRAQGLWLCRVPGAPLGLCPHPRVWDSPPSQPGKPVLPLVRRLKWQPAVSPDGSDAVFSPPLGPGAGAPRTPQWCRHLQHWLCSSRQPRLLLTARHPAKLHPAQPQGLCTDTSVSAPNSCPRKALRLPPEGVPHPHCGGGVASRGAQWGAQPGGPAGAREPGPGAARASWAPASSPEARSTRRRDSAAGSTLLASFLRTPHADSLPVSSCASIPPRGGGEAPRPDAHPLSSRRDSGDLRQVNAGWVSEGTSERGAGAGRPGTHFPIHPLRPSSLPRLCRSPPLAEPSLMRGHTHAHTLKHTRKRQFMRFTVEVLSKGERHPQKPSHGAGLSWNIVGQGQGRPPPPAAARAQLADPTRRGTLCVRERAERDALSAEPKALGAGHPVVTDGWAAVPSC